eukprot:6172320-Pleurochrysis_carterae.AAC.1
MSRNLDDQPIQRTKKLHQKAGTVGLNMCWPTYGLKLGREAFLSFWPVVMKLATRTVGLILVQNAMIEPGVAAS